MAATAAAVMFYPINEIVKAKFDRVGSNIDHLSTKFDKLEDIVHALSVEVGGIKVDVGVLRGRSDESSERNKR